MAVFLIFLLLSVSFARDYCLQAVENPYGEPYIDYAFRRAVERAVLEAGGRLSCKEGSKRVRLKVESLKETPIAFTPQQRVSSYNLELKLSLQVEEEKKGFSVALPYSQPTGGLGDLPRRKAVDDAFGIIYLQILEFLGRR